MLRIATFHEQCVPAPDLNYSGRDRLGVPTGAEFNNGLFAVAHGDLTRWSASLRGPGELIATTPAAALLDLMLKTNAYIREIRCHYPLCVKGRREPLIIDRVISVERRDLPGVAHLHAVSCSAADLQRARRWLDLENITYEVFDPGTVPTFEERNASFTYGIARSMNILEKSAREDAAKLARCIYESERRRKRRLASDCGQRYRTCTLDRLMKRLSRRMDVSLDSAYSMLGVALILGFVCVAPGHELNPFTPLQLSSPLVRHYV